MSKAQHARSRGGRPPSVNRLEVPEKLYNALNDIGFFSVATASSEVERQLVDASEFGPLDRFRAAVRRMMALHGGVTDDFVQTLGRSWKTIERYLDGTTQPSSDFVNRLCFGTGVTPNWLAWGKATAETASVGPWRDPLSKRFSSGFLAEHVDQFVLVPRYEIEAAAGIGRLVVSEDIADLMAFRREWLRRINVDPHHLGIITADGTSMEPTIPDGSLMLIDLADRVLRNGHIYVIFRDGSLVVKRVQLLQEGVALISDNPLYEREFIPRRDMADILVAGRARWVGHAL